VRLEDILSTKEAQQLPRNRKYLPGEEVLPTWARWVSPQKITRRDATRLPQYTQNLQRLEQKRKWMKRWSPEKQRQQRMPMARATRGGEPEGKREVDNKADFQDTHGSDIGRAWTKRDPGGSWGRPRITSLFDAAYLSIEMSKPPL